MKKYDMLVNKFLDDGDEIYHIIDDNTNITDEMIYDYDDHLLVSNYWYFKDMGIDYGRILPITCMSGMDIRLLFKSISTDAFFNGKYMIKDVSELKNDEYYSFIRLFDSNTIGLVKVHTDDSYFCNMPNLLNSYYISLDGTFKPNIDLNIMLDNDDRMIESWRGYNKGKDFLDIMHFSDILDYIDMSFAYQYECDIFMNSDYEMKYILEKSYDKNKIHDILRSQYLFSKAITEYRKIIAALPSISCASFNDRLMYEALHDIINSYYCDPADAIVTNDNMCKELVKLVLCDENGTYINKRPNITNIKNDKELIKEVLRLYKLLIQNKGGY